MSTHVPQYVASANTPQEHRVYCQTCGQTSGWLSQKWEAQDWWRKHLEEIERIKAHLGTKTPSLAGQQSYYQKMAEDPKTDPKDRPIWQQLSDELRHRLNKQGADEQDPLPGMP